MGGGRLRASVADRAAPRSSMPLPLSPLRLSRHSCAGRNPPQHPRLLPQFIPPPSQGGGEVGGQRPRASVADRAAPRSSMPLPLSPLRLLRHSYASPVIPTPLPSFLRPSPSFLRRQEPTPAPTPPSPIHPSPLPGGRLGGGWNAASMQHQLSRAPIVHAPQLPPTVLPYPRRTRVRPNAHLPAHQPTPHPKRDHPRRITPGHREKKQTRTPNTAVALSQPPTPAPRLLPHFIPPPSQGGRLGGGWNAASMQHQLSRAPIGHAPQLPPTVLPYPRRTKVRSNAHLPVHHPPPHPRRDHPRRITPEQP